MLAANLPSNTLPRLKEAFARLLGRPAPGAVAFVRCLAADTIRALAAEPLFAFDAWKVFAVTDVADKATRSITADQAVEWREDKADPVLLLVDTDSAGAGMDGIYSAAREIGEDELFNLCLKLAHEKLPKGSKDFARSAGRKARQSARNQSLAPWREFAYLCRGNAGEHQLGEALPVIGLWPIAIDEELDADDLERSALLVERLLPRIGNRQSPSARVAALRLPEEQAEIGRKLSRFLSETESLSRLDALHRLEAEEDFWINRLRPGVFEDQSLTGIEWIPWRGKREELLKWSGLMDNTDRQPELRLNANDDDPKNRAKLEVRWKASPAQLAKGAVDYIVQVCAGQEVLAEKTQNHQAKPYEKCLFVQDDFNDLELDVRFEARVVIRAIAGDGGEDEDSKFRAVSEDFILCFGERTASVTKISARNYPTLALAVADLAPDAEHWQKIATEGESNQFFSRAKNGAIIYRVGGKTGAVLCPNLLLDLATDWGRYAGAPGRWRLRVRADGSRAGAPEFIPFPAGTYPGATRFEQASATFWKWLAKATLGPLTLLYAEQKPVVDYVNAAIAWWEFASPESALIQTLQVVSVSGQTIGLIVLPTHPLRVAWQQGFDQLVMHHRFQNDTPALKLKNLLSNQSGAHYPTILPGVTADGVVSQAFVYADHLGFHAVAMTREDDPEPKATVALLARLLAHDAPEHEETLAPSIGRSAAELLGREVASYLTLHSEYRRVRIHALRPGDAKPAARALGKALRLVESTPVDGDLEPAAPPPALTLELELYPAKGSTRLSGRFLSSAAERKRTGAGVVPEEDRWMLDSVRRPGGVSLPRLSWCRRPKSLPETSAHLALAFDLLESRIECRAPESLPGSSILELHGLALTPDRRFIPGPIPHWVTTVGAAPEGEKHPAGRVFTDRLLRAHAHLLRLVAKQASSAKGDLPVLITEVSADQDDMLTRLHSLCDWVVSVDRHAGVEYFDSPRDLPRPYDAYLIDCVPERDDLGFLQLITSTSSLDEVRTLVGDALAEMGLSSSPGNCMLLLNALKSLSGRLALRLAHAGRTIAELIALALLQNQAATTDAGSTRWPALSEGFFVPVDDVPELLRAPGEKESKESGEDGSRADLLYVTAEKRGGLRFRFVEVKFRRHLKTARSSDVTDLIESQLKKSWDKFSKLYGPQASDIERTVLRLRLARFLRFYLRKARRHGLGSQAFDRLTVEVDRLSCNAASYEFPDFSETVRTHQGYVLCPEYVADEPVKLEHPGTAEIWLFGPGPLKDVPIGTMPAGLGETTVSGVPIPSAAVATIESGVSSASSLSLSVSPELSANLVSNRARILLGHQVGAGDPVDWSVSTQGNPHLLVVGLPGMGKTTSLIQICTQLKQSGISPVVFSYHEDIDEKLSIAFSGGVRKVSYSGLGFNPLQVVDEGPLAYMDNVGMLRDIFACIFPDLGDVQLGRLREALKRSYQDQGWSIGVSGNVPAFRAFYDILRAEPKPDKPLLLRLDELADYGFFEATSGGQSLLDSSEPTLVQIHATQNDLLQRAFASFVLHNLYQAMFRRGVQQRITHAIVFDEAHRAAKLKLIPTMAKECRKYGLALIVASQEVKDFDDSLFTAVASFLALRTSEGDAKRMAKIFAPSDKLALFTDRLKQTDKYRAWFHSEGLRSPLQLKLVGE
ncbi:ATP-binding protein [Hydrocarboniphaga effusa]|uniref:ATP-binding protein n=1 Tax=Hydrocarboniphaga effusa TaxID=243629 RepID=UPI00398BF49D